MGIEYAQGQQDRENADENQDIIRKRSKNLVDIDADVFQDALTFDLIAAVIPLFY